MAGQEFNRGRGINRLGEKPPFVKGGETSGKTANGGASKGGGSRDGGVSLDGKDGAAHPDRTFDNYVNQPADTGMNTDRVAKRHSEGQRGSARGRASNNPRY